MAVDESFKRPGAVPFKWEIKPGVPKVVHHPHHQPSNQRSTPKPPQKLRPPPAGIYFYPPVEPATTHSVLSTSRSRSEHKRFDQPSPHHRTRSVSPSCFPTPLLKRKDDKKSVSSTETEPDYTSDLETLARWSASTWKSLSPFRDSPLDSISSRRLSSRPVGDAEWAAFGLF